MRRACAGQPPSTCRSCCETPLGDVMRMITMSPATAGNAAMRGTVPAAAPVGGSSHVCGGSADRRDAYQGSLP
jgi:hypothetical protein